jgi:16S rRNA (cytosine967-C5)-methyltransferase
MPLNIWLAWTALNRRDVGRSVRDAELDLVERLKQRRLDDAAMPEAVRLECPAAFERDLRKALGSAFEKEMKASLEPAPVDLRVNTLKATQGEVMKRLRRDKIEAAPTRWSPWGLRSPTGTNISAHPAFAEGEVEFQDEGSQLAALLCDAKPGMQVIDFCAGTGGKTLALAAAMRNKGHLIACDPSEVRLARAKLRLKRAGAENAERIQLPANDDKRLKKLHGKFDRVFVDAPCSGTGSWRRNPDARWSTQAQNLDELTALQDSILARAANFVKPGGRLIYATCSLIGRENDDRVTAFLKADTRFAAVDAREVWAALTDKPWPCGAESVLRLSPARHGTDGFFAAVLRRV